MTAKRRKTTKKQQVPGRPFVKGDPRINRKGRPPKEKILTNLALEFLESKADVEVGNIKRGSKTWRELIVMGWLIQMVKGNPKSLEMFLDRVEGKPAQKIEVDEPIQVEHSHSIDERLAKYGEVFEKLADACVSGTIERDDS